MKRIKTVWFARVLEWLTGNRCLLCDKMLPNFSFLMICPCCLRKIRQELLFLRFQTDEMAIFSLFEYCGLLKRLVKRVKYNHCRLATYALIHICSHAFLGRFGSDGRTKEDFDGVLIIPVPCSHKSIRVRGWDPVSLLAVGIVEMSGGVILPIIKRNPKARKQKQQKKLNREERLEASILRFQIDSKKIKDIPNNLKKIIILDDVMTTGATLKSISTIVNQTPSLELGSVEHWVICCD